MSKIDLKLSPEQNKVLNFLQNNEQNGFYSARDIHENVFGKCVSRRRGFAANKTQNILKALLNNGFVKRKFTERYEYCMAKKRIEDTVVEKGLFDEQDRFKRS